MYKHGWPSGLRRQFKVLFSSGAWVRTPLHAFLAQEDVYRNENVFTLFYFNLFCFSLFYFHFVLFFLYFVLFSLLFFCFLCFLCFILFFLFSLFIFFYFILFYFYWLVQVGQGGLLTGRFISSRIHPFPSEHGRCLEPVKYHYVHTDGNIR